ncbi:MAG TPA: peptidylprolyl isomerase [Asticcacaulis sp.]|nr:peptidylprolyl isomerase [Asticcacaulis sp.]
MRRAFLKSALAFVAALTANRAWSQSASVSADATSAASSSSAAPVRKPATVKVALKTGLGAIVLELEKERAPITTKNFLAYVDKKLFDNTTFYRAMPAGNDEGLIQGGNDTGALPPIPHEPTGKTGLSHTDGAVSMARLKPGSARGGFFICIGDLTAFDEGKDGTPDKLGFAAFGHVVEGMDVVKAIFHSPVSQTKGAGAMKGQMLSPPIKIISARRIS